MDWEHSMWEVAKTQTPQQHPRAFSRAIITESLGKCQKREREVAKFRLRILAKAKGAQPSYKRNKRL